MTFILDMSESIFHYIFKKDKKILDSCEIFYFMLDHCNISCIMHEAVDNNSEPSIGRLIFKIIEKVELFKANEIVYFLNGKLNKLAQFITLLNKLVKKMNDTVQELKKFPNSDIVVENLNELIIEFNENLKTKIGNEFMNSLMFFFEQILMNINRILVNKQTIPNNKQKISKLGRIL